uniref:ATP synthase subunit 8 n=1 Tax=Psammoneis japonica TaxID=517775 RepID=A0A2U9GJ18_9STRA|nr:ATP synthase subunit 8 [Psammoneis japonica]AWQ64262.1 ATP synthase subunit 8 [Psammoneis japonica]
MPQFDLLTIGSQVFGLLVFLYFLYLLNIQIAIPSLIEIQKFRVKKLVKNQEKIVHIKNYLNDNLRFTYNFYQIFLK